jgi:hypothetical protein
MQCSCRTCPPVADAFPARSPAPIHSPADATLPLCVRLVRCVRQTLRAPPVSPLCVALSCLYYRRALPCCVDVDTHTTPHYIPMTQFPAPNYPSIPHPFQKAPRCISGIHHPSQPSNHTRPSYTKRKQHPSPCISTTSLTMQHTYQLTHSPTSPFPSPFPLPFPSLRLSYLTSPRLVPLPHSLVSAPQSQPADASAPPTSGALLCLL